MDSIVALYGSSSGSESSDDDEETAVASNGSSDSEGSNAASGAAAAAAGCKRKRRSDEPSPPPSWVRAFAHVDGNWPSHVSITIGDDAELRALCNRVISGAQQSMREGGGAGADAEAAPLVPMESYHLSLSRPFVLQYDQISVFVDELCAALKWRHRFVISLSDATVLVNDEKTRSFLALHVAGGEKEFLATVKCVDRCMKQFALPLYYEDPIPHVSIASSLGSSLPERLLQAQVHKLFLNETPWSTVIMTVHVAIGNKQFQIPLQ